MKVTMLLNLKHTDKDKPCRMLSNLSGAVDLLSEGSSSHTPSPAASQPPLKGGEMVRV